MPLPPPWLAPCHPLFFELELHVLSPALPQCQDPNHKFSILDSVVWRNDSLSEHEIKGRSASTAFIASSVSQKFFQRDNS